MSDTVTPATEAQKTQLENVVAWYLQDKLRDASTPIATKKYLTSNNVLVYLTSVSVAEANVPRVKVQTFTRVDGGVQETAYQLFGDHRFIKLRNDMIFGAQGGSASGNQPEEVDEAEAGKLLELVNSLTAARQTL